MSKSLRVVNYAVNGSGSGHLTRLCAINRWLRRYTDYLGLRLEIYFLTSSEADTLLFHERFASFKLPSKTVVAETGIDKAAYLALAKQWVWHSLGLLRPDLLLVDTFPQGSFGELLSALDLCRRKAFVHRPVKDSFARRPDFQAMLPLYDLILVPEYEDAWPAERLAPGLRRRTIYTGPVMARERSELLARPAARAALGIAGDNPVIYVSAGGGGDPGAERDLSQCCEALLAGGDGLGPVHVVVGAGPLYRGKPLRGPRLTFLTDSGVAELMLGFDAAVCAAGYNTFYELLHAGVPAVLLPQAKVADEQARRAARAAEAGAARVLSANAGPAALRQAVAALLSADGRADAATAARSLAPRNHARDAAAALLRLFLTEADVDAAVDAVDDDLLLASQETGTPLATAIEVLRDLEAPRRAAAESGEPALPDDYDDERTPPVLGEAGEGAIPPGQAGQAGEDSEEPLVEPPASAATAALLRQLHEASVPPSMGLPLVRLLAARLRRGSAAQRASAIRAVLWHLRAFHDWAGALALLRVLPPDSGLRPAELAAELGAFLDVLAARGGDLYRGVVLLVSAQGELPGQRADNRALLRAARARLESA